MQESIARIPGYSLNEYMLILSPHEALQEKISRIKKEISGRHENASLLYRKPVLRLARFFSWQMTEEKLLNHFKISAMGMPPFKVQLQNYGSFPSHTLYVNVTSKLPLQMLMKEIKSARRLIRAPETDPYFVTEFFIPLAVNLRPGQYNSLWREYSHRQFTGSFVADSMLLLCKEPGNKHYRIAARLEFQNLPVAVTQGQLF